MAELNINIINPIINLISNKRETSNSCETVITFDVVTVPYSDVIVAIDVDIFVSNDLDREASVDYGAGFINLTNVQNFIYPTYFPDSNRFTFKRISFKTNSTGKATVRFILGNSGSAGNFKTADVYIKDVTNSKEKRVSYTRYNDSALCQSVNNLKAINDTYSINKGATAYWTLLDNDEGVSAWGDDKINLKSNPTVGIVSVLPDVGGEPTVEYIHNGGTSTVDSFTYSFTNYKGESNIATVTINIIQPDGTEAPRITNKTKVLILFDGSGSMGETLPILESMQQVELKNLLLPYYNSEASYNEKVTILNMGKSERFLNFVNDSLLNYQDDTVVLIFQNEAIPVYETDYIADPITPEWKIDIDKFYSIINTISFDVNTVLFQVNYEDSVTFVRWLEYVTEGQGNYSGNKGFSGYTNFKVSYEVKEGTEVGATEQYYADLIKQELNNLGFNL